MLGRRDRGEPLESTWAIGIAAVFVVAVVARLAPVVHGAGFGANQGYDASVYYAAGDALTHGWLPYRDFVLLHPPGIMLVLAPFAVLGRVTSDHVGFIAAGLGFTVLGGINAALVVAVARKLGAGLFPSVVGGAFAALWVGSVRAEYLTRLEPLGNLFVLLGLYAYATALRRPSPRWFFAMGAALGTACTVKIWYVVPLFVLVVAVSGQTRSLRVAAATVAGAASACVVVDGFFFAAAPGPMWQMVIADQLGRNRAAFSPLIRFEQAFDLSPGSTGFGPRAGLLTALGIAVMGLLLVFALLRPVGRVLVVLVVAQAGVLALAPSWFTFYADFLTPPLAVGVAVGADIVRTSTATALARRRNRLVLGVGTLATAVTVLVSLAVPVWSEQVGKAFPNATLVAAASTARCVTSDSPMALIELDALSRSFAPGCHDWVDVTGRTYGADRMNARRFNNTRWQHDLRTYLLSGNAFIVIRRATGFSTSLRAELDHRPVLARVGRHVLYRGTAPAAHPTGPADRAAS